jgi:hypothetical protein
MQRDLDSNLSWHATTILMVRKGRQGVQCDLLPLVEADLSRFIL